jgi:ribosomal protein S18 acetylase RimI-like enzyme
MIRAVKENEVKTLFEIVKITFKGISIDENIEKTFGKVIGKDWWERKAEDIQRDFDADPLGVFVEEIDGKIAGFITTFSDSKNNTGRIPHLAVLPGYQGKGIGRKLLEHSFAHFKKQGLKLARIEVLVNNANAHKLYTKMGFKEVAGTIHLGKSL